jgi:HSP20 family molecular chaperone IbpA
MPQFVKFFNEEFNSFFDDFFSLQPANNFFALTKTFDQGFPFCDVVEDFENGKLFITLAISGFKKENVKISTENGFLKIEGQINEVPVEKNTKQIVKGISKRSFKKVFYIPEKYNPEPSAILEDGLLKIEFNLDINKPQPKIIEIQ